MNWTDLLLVTVCIASLATGASGADAEAQRLERQQAAGQLELGQSQRQAAVPPADLSAEEIQTFQTLGARQRMQQRQLRQRQRQQQNLLQHRLRDQPGPAAGQRQRLQTQRFDAQQAQQIQRFRRDLSGWRAPNGPR